MCGICGIFSFKGEPILPETMERMIHSIRHRGPDDKGVWIQKNVGLGHTRLSILDLSSKGHQPMTNEDESVWLTYNGEIYNAFDFVKELEERGHKFKSKTDSEVMIHLYEEYGIDFVTKIKGMFALGLMDRKRNVLYLIRDRVGMKPLFYYQDSERLIFGSEIKALLASKLIGKKLEVESLFHTLFFMTSPPSMSIFKGVQKVPPGSYLKIDESGVSVKKYWNLDVQINKNLERKDVQEEFESVLTSAVSRHMLSDVPVGAFLSGGIDSTLVSLKASREARYKLNTFNITFPEVPQLDESSYAEDAASKIGSTHYSYEIKGDFPQMLEKVIHHVDEPFAVSSAFALYYLSQKAREKVKVVLTGDGGDEIFSGYEKYFMFPHENLNLKSPFLKEIVKRTNQKMFIHFSGTNLGRKWFNFFEVLSLNSTGAYTRNFQVFKWLDTFHLLHEKFKKKFLQYQMYEKLESEYWPGEDISVSSLQKQIFDMRTSLVEEMFTKVDRMTMAWGLEARIPLLDHELVEYSFSTAALYNQTNGIGKYPCKKALEPYFSKDFIYREKSGFTIPFDYWYRNHLKEFMLQLLSRESIEKAEVFNYREVQRIIDDHLREKNNNGLKINTLVVFQIWFNNVFQRN